ncbi:HD-GYP domain-containing protein [Paraliobacillus zengyii]|uniref:HD-GYP domain-containing protein n=1 Tax=Paraliobacillus zengyii TaxID=2213194 RepID=UPI000DD4A742|nr:HD-GYP domain-containing protein [Paraliobacillus zengyii]
MRLVATRSIQEGSELAKPIYNGKSKILIQKNVKLTFSMIQRLKQLGITYVYIKDALTEDIMINSPIPDELRLEAIQTVKESFAGYRNQGFGKNAFLLEKTNVKMDNLVNTMVNQIQRNDEVLSIMSDIFISDDYVFSHSVNVTIYSLALANELKLNNKKIKSLGLGAMLHDVGKVFIPEGVLNKTGKLTEEEFAIIQAHPEMGFEFLRQSSSVPLLVAHCAFQHHERLDGSGYPRGLKGNEIHQFGKILGVADVFDAVTSNRVYRDAMLPQEGLEILYAGSGTLFDQEMVRTFRETIAIYPNGVTVQLSDNRTAIVVKQNTPLQERPIVRVLKENNIEVTPYDLDLSVALDVMIIEYNI